METQVLSKIDKYSLSGVKFTKREVLLTDYDITLRQDELKRGLLLGNLYKGKTKLRFENADGELLETEGAIWAVTEQNVILKNHIWIPIKCIFEVIV